MTLEQLFGASIEVLFGIALLAFALLRWGSRTLFRRKGEAKLDLPDM